MAYYRGMGLGNSTGPTGPSPNLVLADLQKDHPDWKFASPVSLAVVDGKCRTCGLVAGSLDPTGRPTYQFIPERSFSYSQLATRPDAPVAKAVLSTLDT